MTTQSAPIVDIVIPCFNEESVIAETASQLLTELERLEGLSKLAKGSGLLFVDDGSTDNTWSIIQQLAGSHSHIKGVKLSRNQGHQYALYAGLMESIGDVVISIDADLQDDVSAMEKMLDAHADGCEIVYGVRSDRATDTFFKRSSAGIHYRLMENLGVQTVRHHADFRLMSRRAVAMLAQYRETNLYLRGIVPLIGLKSAEVHYQRQQRSAGESKYAFRRMLGLSVQGMTSFSIMPLRLIAALGTLIFIASMLMGGWALHAVFFGDGVVAGWASTVIPIYILGGVQLFAIGVVGEYIGKTYMEVKSRPHYLIESRIGVSAAE